MQTAVRIVVLDYYMSAPIPGLDITHSDFRGTSVSQVPVLRCFGSTEAGRKICVHIHGVFPYLYIPYDGRGKAEELMSQIAAALDKAINISFNQASSSTQHVYKVSLISGIPMYGYHSKSHQFFKIYLYNPSLIPKAGNILMNKNVLDQVFQPHEVHLSFTLQFMIDYNLHGMSNMVITDIKYRGNPSSKIVGIEERLFLSPDISKTSLCELEADISAESIVNRLEVLGGNLAVNPGIAALWEDEKQRRRNKNEDSQLGSFLELKNMQTAPTKTHLIFQQALKERLAVLSTDKDTPKQSPDISVYPAETPHDSNIQNASFVKIHGSSSFELSLDDTLGLSYSQGPNESIIANNNSFNVTMDEDAQDFLHLLEELAGEKVIENEDGSILSQALPEEQNDDLAEDFLDLSMPLGSHTTPVKTDSRHIDSKSDEQEADYFNTTLIPQVDGQMEQTDSDDEPLSLYRKKFINSNTVKGDDDKQHYESNIKKSQHVSPVKQKCGRSMPLLNISNMTVDVSVRPPSPLNKFSLVPYVKLRRVKVELIVQIEPLDMKKALRKRPPAQNTKTRRKRSPKEILEENLRLVRFRMGRIKAKGKVKSVGKILRSNDDYTMGLFKKRARPKFNIVPGKKWFLESPRKDDNSSVIRDLLQLAHNYTDPDLHILVKTPVESYFFYYGGYMFPCAVEIPSKLSDSERGLLVNTYSVIKKPQEKDDVSKRRKLALLQKKILNLNLTRKNSIKLSAKFAKPQETLENAPNSLNSTERTVPQVVVKEEFAPIEPLQRESNLEIEVQEANEILADHLQFLKRFDFTMRPSVKSEQHYPKKFNKGITTKANAEQNTTLYRVKEVQQSTDKDYRKVNYENCVKESLCMKNCSIDVPIEPSIEKGEPVMNSWTRNVSELCYSIDYEAIRALDSREEQWDNISSQRSKLKGAMNPLMSYSLHSDMLSKNESAPIQSFKRSTSCSMDSDYASFLGGNASTRNTSFNLDYELSLLNLKSEFKRSPSTSISSSFSSLPNFKDINDPQANKLETVMSSTDSTKNEVIDEVDSELNSPGNSSESKSPQDKKPKPRINVISNIQIPGPLKIKFLGRSASSIPFGTGTDDGSALCNGRCLISEEGGSSILEANYWAKPLIKRRHSIPNMYINCDGAADSSSGDEQKSYSKRKRAVRKFGSHQYAPLGITVVKSPRIQGSYVGGLEPNPSGISGNHNDQQETTPQLIHSDSSVPFKRKLMFEGDPFLNATSSEEFVSCTYSSKPASKTQITEANKSSVIQGDRLESPNFQKHDSSSSDSDLFSDNDDFNQSFFKSYNNLTVAERYDKQNNYKAREGCSTIFTPSLSLNSQERRGLSDNTSSDIPPYQTCATTKNNKRTDRRGNILQPAFKAPTRYYVENSLAQYKIPCVQQQEPFYSNVSDYTGVVEIGHRVLRIASKTTAHLIEFESEYDGMNAHRKYVVENVAQLFFNSNNIKTLKLTHCVNKLVVVRPVKKAPSVSEVREWIETNSKFCDEIKLSSERKIEHTKIHIPNSPGNDSDLDLDLSLSLTPLKSSPNPNELPNSELSTSPILGGKKIKRFKNRKLPSLMSSERANNSCQITGMTQQNSFGFDKSVQNLQAVRAIAQYQYLTTMVMELHIRTRGDLKPDPQFDNICAIFYSILNDVPESDVKPSKARGVIAINCLPSDLGATRPDFLNGLEFPCDISYVNTEKDLIDKLISVINYWDPDILAGYEIEMLSWGYLVDRAFALSLNILPLLGRSQLHKFGKAKLKYVPQELETNVIGRIVLNVWRIMRHEIALQSYTFESIVYHILHRRLPMYTYKDLTFWWDHRTNLYRYRVVKHYFQRADTVLELFDKLDFLNRTSELARLFGIMFYEVLSRGSQFRVESMMLRLAKPLNYVPVSPDVKQRAKMKAPEFIPLVMEPESKLYTDPVIVLDFQSLYPSIIIAYNYCFTTCVGRVNKLGANHSFEFGATQLRINKKVVYKLCKRELLNYSPCGVAFVKQKVREGILPRMLKEVLDTRLMVKNSMKENKANDNLQKVLHNRQLGLKLIANVTYGYTAANFSGRMCCVEVGDSVVSKGRETLQRAVALVESTPEWEARVVYGDTDSMFVLVPGKTKEEAFEIGKKIADAVTTANPDPIKLKLEKVYQPCILQTKKRYVGYMYEGPEQREPVYEAKGIETVRRDGCPAVAKMLQKCLTLLFETKNVSLVKNYVLKQFNKIQTGRASIQDFTFAKEYRGASGYKPGACVPALELAHKWTAVDRRNEPRRGERVPYVIVNGPPGLPLIRLVRSPRDLLSDSSLRPNSLYYITKVIIPPINRCFNLIGADLNVWFNQMPRKSTQYLPNSSPIVKSTISQYFATKICASCLEPTLDGLCAKCCRNVNITALTLTEKLRRWEENYNNTLLICQSCTGYLDEAICCSLDCPVLYRRSQTFNDLQQSTYVRDLLASNSIFS